VYRLPFFLFLLILPAEACADTPDNGSFNSTICSLNTDNLGFKKKQKTKKSKRSTKYQKRKLEHLARRINSAGCSIVAVQEVYGPTRKQAKSNLLKLEKEVEKITSKNFSSFVGDTQDSRIRNGFLIEKNRQRVIETFNFSDRPLPRDLRFSRLGYYSRGPFAVLLEVQMPRGGVRQLLVLSVHFKSKSGSFKDPTKTSFERLRVQMAEGVKTIVKDELRKRFPEAILVVAGDLNSERFDAASQVIDGTFSLADFSKGSCRIDKELEADCDSKPANSLVLKRLFSEELQHWPGELDGGSYKYKGKDFLIDEILVETEAARLFLEADGSYDLGFSGQFYRGSDHKLLWARISWPQ